MNIAASVGIACALLTNTFSTHARDLYVDPQAGVDGASGLAAKVSGTNGPVKTIARGLKLAQPGDTVHLTPIVFRESAVFANRAGEAGRPITLDGRGATLDGSEPIDPAGWKEVAPHLFRHDQLLAHLDDAIIQRWYFLWDGKMNRMGRTSKGPSAPLKTPEELQPGEWTFVKDESRQQPNSLQIFGSFFVKLPLGQTLAEAHIAMPVRSAGVQLSGTNRWLVIRNLTATHVYNDGYNIHGHCENVMFENIRAIECGDDGISAHETAQYRVNGFVSIGNSTGICDTGDSETNYERVFIRDCVGHDLYFLDRGRYSVRHAIVQSSAARALVVAGREPPARPCSLTLENVFIRRTGSPGEVRVSKYSTFTAHRTTFENLNFQATGGETMLQQCLITGEPTPEILLWREVQWRGHNNLYHLRTLRFDRTTFTPQTFVEFQKLTGQEIGSAWRDPEAKGPTPGGVGADLPALEKLALPAGEASLKP